MELFEPYDDITLENSLIYFLITVSKLNLSKEAGQMLYASYPTSLLSFISRYRYSKPKGILVL